MAKNKVETPSAIKEARLSVIDSLHRQGQDVFNIAVYLLSNDQSKEMGFDNGLSLVADMPFPDKIKSLIPIIKDCINTIKTRFRMPVDLEDRKEALFEYVTREDEIFTQAMRIQIHAFDNRDKLGALKLAQEAAQNKARALGVELTPNLVGVPPPSLPNGVMITSIGQIVNMASSRELPNRTYKEIEVSNGEDRVPVPANSR